MGSKFSGNVRNECGNSHAKFGGAALRRFYAIWKKTSGEDIRPPVGARVVKYIVSLPKGYVLGARRQSALLQLGSDAITVNTYNFDL